MHLDAHFYTAHPPSFVFLPGDNIELYYIIFGDITIWRTEVVITHMNDLYIHSFDCMVCRSFHTTSRYDFRSNVIRLILSYTGDLWGTSGLPGTVNDVRLKLTLMRHHNPASLSCKGYLIICKPCNFERFEFQYGINPETTNIIECAW